MQVMTFESCKVNGYKFCTRSASGSGVIVRGTSHDNNLDYYGQLEEKLSSLFIEEEIMYIYSNVYGLIVSEMVF